MQCGFDFKAAITIAYIPFDNILLVSLIVSAVVLCRISSELFRRNSNDFVIGNCCLGVSDGIESDERPDTTSLGSDLSFCLVFGNIVGFY